MGIPVNEISALGWNSPLGRLYESKGSTKKPYIGNLRVYGCQSDIAAKQGQHQGPVLTRPDTMSIAAAERWRRKTSNTEFTTWWSKQEKTKTPAGEAGNTQRALGLQVVQWHTTPALARILTARSGHGDTADYHIGGTGDPDQSGDKWWNPNGYFFYLFNCPRHPRWYQFRGCWIAARRQIFLSIMTAKKYFDVYTPKKWRLSCSRWTSRVRSYGTIQFNHPDAELDCQVCRKQKTPLYPWQCPSGRGPNYSTRFLQKLIRTGKVSKFLASKLQPNWLCYQPHRQ